MSNAQFEVQQAGPLVSFQDGGRKGHMRFGVSASGPMDSLSHAAANLAVGNSADATAIEISIGGLSIKCVSGSVTIAIVGMGFNIKLDDAAFPAGVAMTVETGSTLIIQPGSTGSWCYLAFAGSVNADQWLSHTATHTTSGFGGGLLKQSDSLEITNCRTGPPDPIIIPPFLQRSSPDYVRIVLGPQSQHFKDDAKQILLGSQYSLSTAYDRMGVRLDGPPLPLESALSIPSEPILKGSVQVSGEGIPTILLADHQTTGGYPKIATVISCDLDAFVQLRPRDVFRFSAVTPQNAVKLARLHSIETRTYLETIEALHRQS